MKKIKITLLLLALCCSFVLSISAADGARDNFGEIDVFDSQETVTSEPEPSETEEQTTEPGTTNPSETTEPITEPVTSEPEASGSEEQTNEPESSTSETESTTEETTPTVETTEPDESTAQPSEQQTTEPIERPGESDTISDPVPSTPIPLPLILAGLGVLAIGCIAFVVVVMIKYFRAQK